MKIITEDWAKTLKTAWSVHALALIGLGGLFMLLESLLPDIAPDWLGPRQAAVGAVVLSVLGIVGRIVVQQAAVAWAAGLVRRFISSESGALKMRKRTVGGVSAAVIAMATASISVWEGTELESYWDKYGRVWTACTGETRGIGPNMTFTAEECRSMLDARVIEFHGELSACISNFNEAPATVQAATVSWAYNVGSGAACRSTLAKRLRAKSYTAACNELPRWNRAGGQVLRGLVNRRVSERKLCLSGI